MKSVIAWIAVAAVGVAGLAYGMVQGGRVSDLEGRIQRFEAALAGASAKPARSADEDAPQAAPEADTWLRMHVSDLDRRVGALEKRGGGASTKGRAADDSGATDGDVALLREDVDALLVGQGLDTEDGQNRVLRAVRQAMEADRKQRAQESFDRRAAEMHDAIEKFAEEANLSGSQKDRLEELFGTAQEKMKALMTASQEGGGPQRRETWQQVRQVWDEADKAAREVLDQDQVAAYEKMTSEFGRFGGRRPPQGASQGGAQSGEAPPPPGP
jgi:hypothetical protein